MTIDGIKIQALFSRNLKRLRGLANISQIQLADRVDLSNNFINDIENGKKWVSPETIAKLSKALKAEPYQFFISDPIWNSQAAEMFSLYLDDLENTHAMMVAEYRSRYLSDSPIKEEAAGPRKLSTPPEREKTKDN